MWKRGFLAVSVAMALVAPPAAAQSLDAVFDAYLLGVRAGTLTVSGSEGGGRYEASAQVRSSGVVAVIARYSFAAASKGRVRGTRLVPESYAERSDTGKRTSDRQVVWRDGVPKVLKTDKTRSYYLDPAAQAGTTDPMTAIFATLRDQPRSELCALDAVFDAYLLGVRAGTLTVSGSEGGGRYEASAQVRSSGVVAVIARYSFAAASKGRVRGTRLVPESYAERSDTGKRTSDRQVVWRDGVPKVIKTDKTRSYYLDPAAQAGTTDPMTAIFATLRDQPRSELCALDLAVFDGARRVQITLDTPRANSPTITCQGLYRRVGGFSDGQMKDGGDFPFTVTYAPQGDLFRAVSIDMTTVRGRAQFVRR